MTQGGFERTIDGDGRTRLAQRHVFRRRSLLAVPSAIVAAPAPALKRLRNGSQSASTVAKRWRTLVSQGTSMGRCGLPSRCSCRLPSKLVSSRCSRGWTQPAPPAPGGRPACARPASLMAAAPPSSCSDIHSSSAMAHSASSKKGAATNERLVPGGHGWGLRRHASSACAAVRPGDLGCCLVCRKAQWNARQATARPDCTLDGDQGAQHKGDAGDAHQANVRGEVVFECMHQGLQGASPADWATIHAA